MIEEHQIVPYRCRALPLEQGPWLVCAPHADDESFGMGGTLALAAARGIQTHLVVLTDGALGGQQTDLVTVRQREARAAARELGIAGVYFFGQPDRGLRVEPALIARLNALLDTLQPSALFFPGVHELHPDHRSCALLAWETLRQRGNPDLTAVAYEISMQSPTNCLVDISAVIERKRAAIAVYMSQLAEHEYLDLALALNRVRSYTLPREVRWVEAFYCYDAGELLQPLQDWALQQYGRVLNG